MKKSVFVGLILFILLFAVVLSACTPKPTAKPEEPEGKTPEEQMSEDTSKPGDLSGGDNDAEWQDGWNDLF